MDNGLRALLRRRLRKYLDSPDVWLCSSVRLEINIKCKWPLLTALVVLSGKEYVGIVRLHNAIESEAQLARVSLSTLLAMLALDTQRVQLLWDLRG